MGGLPSRSPMNVNESEAKIADRGAMLVSAAASMIFLDGVSPLFLTFAAFQSGRDFVTPVRDR
jgi:hypothetical protein